MITSTPARLRQITLLAAVALLLSSAHAADGTWTLAGSSSWDTPGNWSGNTIADGSGFTATFGPISGTAGNFGITVDTARTIGAISFQSTTGNTNNFTVSGSQILTLAGGSTPTITNNLISRTGTISATLAGTQGVNITNTTGTLVLSGNNTYTGVTNVTGALTIGSNTGLGASGTGNETILANGASITLTDGVKVTGETITLNSLTGTANLMATGSAEWAGNVTLNSSSSRIGTTSAASELTISGVIANGAAGNLIISGTSGGKSGTVVLSGANTYTGVTTLYRGTIKLAGGNNRMPIGTTLSMGGTADDSSFNLNGTNQQLAGIADASNTSNRTVTNLSSTASILTLNGSTTANFANTGNTTITGNLALVKAGSFNQTLAKVNTYTGNTTVNAGTLTLASGSTMTFYIGANHVNNGISGTGALALNGTFIFDLTGANTTNGNSWLIADFANLTETIGGTFAVQNFTKSGSLWNFGNYSFSEISGILSYSTGAIPEPSSCAAVAGLLALAAVSLRRRR